MNAKLRISRSAAALLLLGLLQTATASAKISVTQLRTERLVNPMSLNTATPRFGWQITSDRRDVLQTAYHIIVASTPEKAAQREGDLWDARVETDSSQWITYAGRALRPDTRAYWCVAVETNKGKSDWSDVALFNVGLLSEGDWAGRWIGMEHANAWDREDEHSRLSARYLRTEFAPGNKAIRRATLYVSGLGMYEAYIEGRRVGTDVLAPAPTDYRRTVLYNAYDVTSMLPSMPAKHDTMAIAVVIGNGRYYTMQQHKKPYKITNFGYPKLRLNLIIEYTDGTRRVVATNEKWRINADGPIRSNNEYDGETYDARRVLRGWTCAGYDDSAWPEAERTAIPDGTLRGAMSPNMAVVDSFAARAVSYRGDTAIVDFGQNIAGWLSLRLGATRAGDTITICYAERLDSAGHLWRDNFRHAESTDRYIADGQEQGRWWHPTFVYHGGRYAAIVGMRRPIAPSDCMVQVVSDALDESGRLETTDSILQKVYHNARWGVLTNYKGMPVDCPQRDERQPWLGDRTRGCYGEAYLFDVNTLYSKWTRDIAEAQREDGCIPDVAPAFWNYYSDNVTWPAALVTSIDMMLRQYGDDAPLRRHYPNAKRWMEHLKSRYDRNGLLQRDKYGDWCVPPERQDLIHSEDPARKTDGTLIATAYYYKMCRMLQAFAERLGLADDAAAYDEEARRTQKAFNARFLTMKRATSTVPGHILYPDSTYYGNNTATANLLPLAFGMIDDDYVKGEVSKQIVRNIITDNKGFISTGVIGTGWLMHTLTDMGRSDVAWLLATNKKYPSWGYMAEQGATTTWELWNGDTANPRMNSGNHVMLLGDLVSWLYEDVAGIRSDDGYRHITLAPDFSVPEMDNIGATYHSIRGTIVSRWTKQDGRLHWHIELPANTEATLHLPDGTERRIGSGQYDLDEPLPGRLETLNRGALDASLPKPTVVADEWLYKQTSFPECHSASIAETEKGDLVCTYFGGTKERNPDVCIWVSRKPRGTSNWTAPQMVADGVFDANHREACWNPVLFTMPDGTLDLYFKIGPNVAGWKGWKCSSRDGGKTWTQRTQLPDSIYGPIKNKPVMSRGRLISPTSDERHGWKVYFEYSDDQGRTWRRSPFVEADSGVLAIQPSIITLPDGTLLALCRTRSRYIGATRSRDNGATWSPLEFLSTPNNNSGLDAVTLSDGSYALVCNQWPIEPNKTKGARTPLALMHSTDGTHWAQWLTLEDSPISQYSYPSIIQTRDGHLHIVYTWRRQRIRHIEIKF